MPSGNVRTLAQLIQRLDKNKNVWIGDKRKNNIWDRRKNVDKLGESVNEGSKYDEIKKSMEATMAQLIKKMGLKTVVKHLIGKSGMSFFIDDEKEADKMKNLLDKKLKRVRKIKLGGKEAGDTSNWVVAADLFEGIDKSINEVRLGSGKEKVYVLNGMLWISYSPNSGQTTRLRGRGWITDKSDSKNFDSAV
jgi:hypothetical protein